MLTHKPSMYNNVSLAIQVLINNTYTRDTLCNNVEIT